jgi:hypothetical protein
MLQQGFFGTAVVASCSALASVYMEWALKGSRTTSMHVQNAQIYCWGVLLNGAMYLLTRTTSEETAPRCLFHGENVISFVFYYVIKAKRNEAEVTGKRGWDKRARTHASF